MVEHYILEDGEPVAVLDVLEWARWIEAHPDQRFVGKTPLPGGGRVSTVFLGLNHQFGDGPPILWESMVFGADDEVQERYETKAEAEAGHIRLVRQFLGDTGERA